MQGSRFIDLQIAFALQQAKTGDLIGRGGGAAAGRRLPHSHRALMIDFLGAKITWDVVFPLMGVIESRFRVIGPREDCLEDWRSTAHPGLWQCCLAGPKPLSLTWTAPFTIKGSSASVW
jgi:hypothetical protein